LCTEGHSARECGPGRNERGHVRTRRTAPVWTWAGPVALKCGYRPDVSLAAWSGGARAGRLKALPRLVPDLETYTVLTLIDIGAGIGRLQTLP